MLIGTHASSVMEICLKILSSFLQRHSLLSINGQTFFHYFKSFLIDNDQSQDFLVSTCGPCLLNTCKTHLPLDKMAAISQTIFAMHFRERKILYFD